MTNVVEASNMTKEVQVMSKSKSKSPKGDFAALFKLETETLKMEIIEEGEPITKSAVIEIEMDVEEPSREKPAVDEEVDENEGTANLLSYLIQGSPPLQIKSSVPSLKPLEDSAAVGAHLTPAGHSELKEPPMDQSIKRSREVQELAKPVVVSAFKVETPALENLQKAFPEELKEKVTNAIPTDLPETKLGDVLPEKQNKKDAVMTSGHKLELEPQKIEGSNLESKVVPKIVETLEKSNLSFPSGEAKKKENSSDTQKKSPVDRVENFPSTIKENEFHKLQTASMPEETKAENKNLELVTKEILHQMETLTDGNKTMIRVKLHPEEMGEMEISLSMEEGRLTGKIVVGNKEIQQIFTEKLHELNQTLKENRIDVANFEVKISPDQNQNQDQARHQGRRPVDYSNRFKNNRNGLTQTEEWIRPDHTLSRGIDLLA